jgi:outer membrane protein assembly factor BamB
LVVPCGAQLPAFLDLQTGKLDTYCMGWGGRNGLPKGSWFVAGTGTLLSHSGDLYDISHRNEEKFRNAPRQDFKSQLYPGALQRLDIDPNNQRALGAFRMPVLTLDTMYVGGGKIVAHDLGTAEMVERSKSATSAARKGDKYPDRWKMEFPVTWELPSAHQVHIKAGRRLYVGSKGSVAAVKLPEPGRDAKIVWQAQIDGVPHRMLAAAEKLFVVTQSGRLYAFGDGPKSEVTIHKAPLSQSTTQDVWSERATKILEATNTLDGFAVVLGIESGRLVEELVRQSSLYVIGVDLEARRLKALRNRLHEAGIYGTRVSLHVGDPVSFPFPPYLANLVVSETQLAEGGPLDNVAVAQGLHLLRPYGGNACVAVTADQRSALADNVMKASKGTMSVRQNGDLSVVTLDGKLPDSADWSHRAAGAGNQGASDDDFLKAPLGLLWFDGALRWHRKPGSAEARVAGARILIKAGRLTSMDAYTGRVLWEADLPFPHKPTDQLVAFPDAIYVTGGKQCLVLSPTSGKIAYRLELPAEAPGPWTDLRVVDDVVIGRSGQYVVCVDRTSGSLIWKREFSRTFLSIAAGGGKVFCSELINKRKGEKANDSTKTRALDLQTGDILWETVDGTEVLYSTRHDLVLTSRGIYQGLDGKLIGSTDRFESKHGKTLCKPLAIVGDDLLWGTDTSFAVYTLTTGDSIGESTVWVRRGCTDLRAASNLVTTRYRGNCAYIDLESRDITPLWNIRPACNNNLFPANGVLNIPCLTGGCECNYTPASQAYVPMSVVHRRSVP